MYSKPQVFPRARNAKNLGIARGTFNHPGTLHSSEDIKRIKSHVAAQDEPWYRAYQHLASMPLVQTSWKASPKEVLLRAAAGTTNLTVNYPSAYRDVYSAYGLALRWLITGNTSFADAAIKTLDGWGNTLKKIDGNEDKYLATGLYGYQFAKAAELLRDYEGWPKANQTAFGTMLSSTLLNGLPDSSIVINGALPYFSLANFTEEGSGETLMEVQESGRDQSHATLCIALAGVDLYGAFGNQILNGAEYTSKYNDNHSVPYQPYTSWEGNLTVVSEKQRFSIRPGFEAVFAHYNDVRGLNASWTKAYRDYVNANNTLNIEGGGGDYGPNSGGFDAFGHGTLLYRINAG
ncbi:chondroitin AC/alginate lyase [Setomelanomma holmii]|uniref:Chondroitin AC/alginate lyase n=1 Tax=Setomelanomma holmii TaxID=210430 RepID=A0A9P4LFF5_9PLEO|nr:chondroitin AC/alginate lyase [Setomelanomma holmii]